MTNYFERLLELFPRNTHTVAAGKIEVNGKNGSVTHILKVGHTQQEQEEFFSHINKEVDERSGADDEYSGTTVWFTDGSYAIIDVQYDGYDDRYYYDWNQFSPFPIPQELL